MKKKMILLISMIQIMALSACGRETGVTPVETDIAQTELAESGEEVSTVTEEAEKDGEEGGEEGGITEREAAPKSRVLIAYFSQPTDVDTSDHDAVSGASVVVRDDEVAGSTTEYVACLLYTSDAADD